MNLPAWIAEPDGSSSHWLKLNSFLASEAAVQRNRSGDSFSIGVDGIVIPDNQDPGEPQHRREASPAALQRFQRHRLR